MLKAKNGRVLTGFIWLRIGITKHGNELSDCIKMLEIQRLWAAGEELTSEYLLNSVAKGQQFFNKYNYQM
jgi:hypothetical protein